MIAPSWTPSITLVAASRILSASSPIRLAPFRYLIIWCDFSIFFCTWRMP
jgi:hypothetical protein